MPASSFALDVFTRSTGASQIVKSLFTSPARILDKTLARGAKRIVNLRNAISTGCQLLAGDIPQRLDFLVAITRLRTLDTMPKSFASSASIIGNSTSSCRHAQRQSVFSQAKVTRAFEVLPFFNKHLDQASVHLPW